MGIAPMKREYRFKRGSLIFGQHKESAVQWTASLFGLHFAATVYSYPVEAFTGAPQGIDWSWWIYTERHAWGFGSVRAWARLQYLEFAVIGPASPVLSAIAPRHAKLASESGDIELRPGIECAIDGPGKFVGVQFWNNNDVTANIEVALSGMHIGAVSGAESSREDSLPAYIIVPPHATKPALLAFQRGRIVVDRIGYHCEPDEPAKRRRDRFKKLNGRPEFLQRADFYEIVKP
jgi:hypothetical protein